MDNNKFKQFINEHMELVDKAIPIDNETYPHEYKLKKKYSKCDHCKKEVSNKITTYFPSDGYYVVGCHSCRTKYGFLPFKKKLTNTSKD
jgi:hypothetical protein